MKELVDNIIAQGHLLLPEGVLLFFAILLLLIDIGIKSQKGIFSAVTALAILVYGASLIYIQNQLQGSTVDYIWDSLLIDRSALVFQALCAIAGLIYIVSQWKECNSGHSFLIIIILLGSAIVVKSINLLVLLLGVELLSISAYALTASTPGAKAKEAALKYIIFGAIATAFFIFGISLVYGVTGSLNIGSEIFLERLITQDPVALVIIFGFLASGVFFKITAFPFHLWAPNVYEVVSPPLAAFLSIVPKLSVLAFLLKLVVVFNLFGVVEVPWQKFLAWIAILTLTIGNLAALLQKNAQRMLAYSSIAHTGFFLLAIISFSQSGYQAMIFYGAIYLVMNFLAFLLIFYYKENYNVNNINDLKGLAQASPFLTIVMVISMISLTGLPPTAGFTAKVLVFTSLWQTYTQTGDSMFWILLVIGAINAVISLFYYLKIPYLMIFKSGGEKLLPAKPTYVITLNFLSTVLVLILVILFIWPDIIMDLINMINFVL